MLTGADIGLAELLGCEPIVENAKDGTLLLLIPAGEFIAGGTGSDEGGAAFSVRLSAYYLAVHPVTNAQYARFLSERQPSAEARQTWIDLGEADNLSGLESDCHVHMAGGRYSTDPGTDDCPVERVSWLGAQAYCAWAGLRLPTELEWEKGARGTDGRDYPWGGTWDPTKCQTKKSHAQRRTSATWWYAGGNSPWGLSQMTGNGWEWCADWYDEHAYDRYRRGELTPPATGGQRVVRGGSWGHWLFGDSLRNFRCAARKSVVPGNPCKNLGFRCARTMEAGA